MIISLVAEKAFDKQKKTKQTTTKNMIKVSERERIQGIYLNLIKAIYIKPTSN